MTRRTFFIVDDDPSVRRILHNIIEEESLGIAAGEAEDGRQAENRVLQAGPDIVLIDLLLPDQDGIQTILRLRQRGFGGQFIMISQVSESTLISQAYQTGIEFFIHKPLNRLEIVSVVKKVLESLDLHETIERVRTSVGVRGAASEVTRIRGATSEVPRVRDGPPKLSRVRDEVLEIFSEMGILGESGYHDILAIALYLFKNFGLEEGLAQLANLQSLYRIIRDQYAGDAREAARRGPSPDEKAIEQRIRRAIGAAQQNVAALGIEDYGHSVFESYSTKFFDFIEIRNDVRFIKKESPYRGRVNIKKFLEATMIEAARRTRSEN